ncbi:MAG: hypothetical protein OQK24_04540, partial [Magnetovibrio sp.]|nr:hypothetical protein [Magnetovibrio sp.]
ASWAGGGRLRAELRKRTYDGEVARRQLSAERDKTAELEVKLRALEMQNLNTPATTAEGAVKTLEHGGADAVQLPKPKTAA